jgi:hypothetical protein
LVGQGPALVAVWSGTGVADDKAEPFWRTIMELLLMLPAAFFGVVLWWYL